MRGAVKRALGSPRLMKLLARRAPGRVAVLCYHDVREDDDIESWMRVGVSRFAAQLAELGRVVRFVAPEDLEDPSRLDRGRLNVLVTFDDGYVNNLRLAMPVLERLSVPALFFVSTEHVQSGRLFWSDRVITPVQLLGLETLDLSEHGFGAYRFRRRPAARWEDVGRLLRDLKAVGNPDHPRVAAVLDDLERRFDGRVAAHQDRYRPLDEDELRALALRPLAHIGSHAHLHEILTYLDDARLEDSLRTSRRFLEGIVGGPVVHLAYPNGDADDRVVDAARRRGYRYGYLTRGGLAGPGRDPMRLPRVMVGGYDDDHVTRFLINRHLAAAGRG